ncbi:MAG: type IV secretion system DNA-binding domain-containing protein [Archaeoglobaceae archaeon]
MKSWEEYLEERLCIGSIKVPRGAECRHFLILGRSGTGKTRLIYSFLEKLRKREDCIVIIYDFKGDYVSCFYESGDLLFNPLDLRTLHWCPLTEIQAVSDIDSIATSLIPPSRSDDRFWVDGARDVFASLAYITFTRFGASNEELFNLTSLNEKETLEVVTQAVGEGIEYAKKAVGYLEQGQEKGAKMAGDILATMRQYTNCFYYTRHLNAEFSISEFLNSSEYVGRFLFLVGFPKLRDTLRPLFSLFVDLFIKTVLSLSEDSERRIFIFLDEFATLQRLTSIVQGLEQGRSKGMGIVIALQDINQLRRIYSDDTANSIVNNCSTIISFAVNDPASQEYMSRVFGEFEKLETDESLSMGPHDLRDGLTLKRARRIERLILPSEIGALSDLTCYLKMLDFPVARVKIPFVSKEQKIEPLIFDERFLIRQGGEVNEGERVNS